MPTLKNCRACSSTDLFEAFSLGNLAIASYGHLDPSFEAAPLDVLLCRDCGLVQLGETVERERLYRHYYYESGIQESMVDALKEVVNDTMNLIELADGDAWLDIGANDGTLLKHVPNGVQRFAYEPAENLWPKLQQHASIIGRYFPTVLKAAPVTFALKFKVITSVACFYDVDDPNLFVAAIAEALADNGVWVNQMAYLPATLATNNCGDVCHEHLTYWTENALQRILARHGLRVVATTFNDVNGGSFRTVITHGDGVSWADDRVGPIALRRFKQRIDLHRSAVRSFFHTAKRNGEVVVGYGASTKGNTYLQYWGIGTDLMVYIADRNTEKWGTFIPTGQFIIGEDQMRDAKPAYLFVLPWHFADAFIKREAEYLANGGAMVIPYPDMRIIRQEDAGIHTEVPAATAGATQPA